MRIIKFFLVCFITVLLHGQTLGVSIQIVSNYNQWGWDTIIVMQNDCITLATVPDIGARVMQYDLGSIPSIMVNSSLLGKTYTPLNNNQWYNFGGFKNWPSPQNNWPGTWPPPPTLDYGAYMVTDTLQTNDSVSLSVSSPVEKWVAPNIRFKRTTTIYSGTSRVRMEQTIINEGSTSVSWGVWGITQAIVNHTSQTDYQNFWAYFPLNPSSIYGASGVSPQGSSTAWKGEAAPGIYGVQFVPSNAKIFADPAKGWIAYTSLSDTVVFVKTFPIFEGAQYPDGGARVTVYVSSSGPPPYMEIEVKGPVVPLAASGGKYTFVEDWWAAKVRAPILDIDSVGAIAGKLSYNPTTQTFSAIYGVFYKGKAKVVFVNANGQILSEGQQYTVSPLEEFKFQETIVIPDSAKTAEVQVCNDKGTLIGILDSTDVTQFLTGVEARTSQIASKYRLESNYPNPFNPSTTIVYTLPQESSVKVIIYDVQGRIVKSFTFRNQAVGNHKVVWDGTNNRGDSVSSGTYIYRVKASSEDGKTFDKSAKMILLR